MPDFATESLDLIADESLAGFRLQRLEVYNWGTFDNYVCRLEPNGKNALLTGDIGSGKSTLVDAITALLVRADRVAFNKAAGAGSRERTLASYMFGYYKSARNDSAGGAKPVGLRDTKSYTVILAVFHNAGFDETFTLAQVFWHKDSTRNPEKLFVLCKGEMSIAEDFSGFGGNLVKLRKQLRASGAELFDAYSKYAAAFRRCFGIKNEQALELFHQTVSMKSVGNLTDFVRGHMLEPFDVGPRIIALIQHFDDLNRAHEAVLTAKRQVGMLVPLIAGCDEHAQVELKTREMRLCRDALSAYFARIKCELLDARMEKLLSELAGHAAHIDRMTQDKRALEKRRRELDQAIHDNGGGRIEQLKAEIAEAEVERARRRKKAEKYAELVEAMSLRAAEDQDSFLAQRAELAALKDSVSEREAQLKNECLEHEVKAARDREKFEAIKAEVESLKLRTNNIGESQIAIRRALCIELKCGEDQLPFAGELLQVRDADQDWEGAIERLLHNFALSLLVPPDHYDQVATWVDKTHLRARIVYLLMRAPSRANPPRLEPQSVAQKLEIKPDTPHYTWLEHELAHRGNVQCCDSTEEFRRVPRGITRAGQIKSNDQRHEKDDRHRIDDRSRYVLGWNNTAKIAALEKMGHELFLQLQAAHANITRCKQEIATLETQLRNLARLDEYAEFLEIDWKPLARKIAELEEERKAFEKASDMLQSLVKQREDCDDAMSDLEQRLEAQRAQHAKTEQKHSDAKELRAEAEVTAREFGPATLAPLIPELDRLRDEQLGDSTLRVETCGTNESNVRKTIQEGIDRDEKRLKRLQERIVNAMGQFRNAFPNVTREMDASVDAGDEYRALLKTLQDDDLPKFEKKFKELLNENAIREIAAFQSQLNREHEQIKERIALINKSLKGVAYNEGRYIAVVSDPAPDADIRDFRTELRQCTEGSIGGADDLQYTETKFLQVKQIIDRFRGREGQTDLDRRWTANVTDVRNWFVFSAVERWQADDSEFENYPDSGGKSGGQKEKLAYTILAASLAYQFGLEWGETRSRTFRFVMIDEAFGRGSDESAQFALELFKRLNLQLLIVTPLQKIHVIEPYVSSVGFVHNEDGKFSTLTNLTIEEYHAQKQEARA